MAVPKKKRYKQIVKSRRSCQKNNLILKQNISMTKYNNYANNSIISCEICHGANYNVNLCKDCYHIRFDLALARKKSAIRKEKSRDLVREYYVELSKTFFPPSGS